MMHQTGNLAHRWFSQPAMRLNILLLGISILAAGLVLFTTKDGGIGLTPDSVHYIAASKSLLAGHGYSRYWWNIAFASWPPLYPTILAGVGSVANVLNMDILEGIRWTNTFLFGLIVYFSSVLLRRCLRSPIFIVLGTASVALAFPLLTVHVYVWSEPVYILLSLLFVLYLPSFLEQGLPYQFFILVLIAALGTMQRYSGIGIIPFGMVAIVLFLRNSSWFKRLFIGAAFAISTIPYVLWLAYIRTLSTPTIVNSPNPVEAFFDSIALTPPLLAQWFVPLSLRTTWVVAAITLVVIVAIAYGIFAYSRGRLQHPAEVSLRSVPILAALYVCVYMGVYYISHLLIYSFDLDQRHFSVMVPFVMVLIFFGLERIAGQASQKHWRFVAAVMVGAFVLIYPASATGNEILFRQYWCCEGTRRYRDLPIIEWLDQQAPPGLYFSNAPIPLFYTPLPVFSAPFDSASLDTWISTALSSSDDTYLIQFNDAIKLFYQGSDRFYYDFDVESELGATAQVDLIAEFDEGKIYRVRLRPQTAFLLSRSIMPHVAT